MEDRSETGLQPCDYSLVSGSSFSFPSEPPDIRNWFSSYVYESPTSDSILGSDCDDFHTEEGDKDDVVSPGGYRKAINKPQFAVAEKIASNSFTKRNSSIGNKELQEESGCHWTNGKSDRNTVVSLISKCYSQENTEEHTIEKYGCSPIRYAESSTLKAEDSILKLEGNYPKENGLVLLNNEKDSAKKTGKHTENVLLGNGFLQGSSETKYQSEDSATALEGRDLNLKDYNENKIDNITESGFVLVRKAGSRRENDENSMRRPNNFQPRCRNDAPGRRVFLDRTNSQHTEKLEITGKWLCPQKRKQNYGPPLKQLRLEQWVRQL